MKASYLCDVPYRKVAPDAISPKRWVVSGRHFRAADGYDALEEAFEISEAAEAAGFDWISLTEHHYSNRQLSPNPTVLAAAFAERLKKATIALLGPTIPLLNPVRVAEEVAMLDMLTRGRMMVGLLRGTPNEYAAYAGNLEESRAKFDEGLDLILRSWTEPDPFGWEGRYYRYRSVSIWPRPVQKPHPPVMISCGSEEAALKAAANRLGIGFFGRPLSLIGRMRAVYQQESEQQGWTPASDNVVYRGLCYVSDTDEQAEEDVRRFHFGQWPPGVFPGVETRRPEDGGDLPAKFNDMLFWGSPDTVLKQIRYVHAKADPGVIDLNFTSATLPGELSSRSFGLFSNEVLPAVRAL